MSRRFRVACIAAVAFFLIVTFPAWSQEAAKEPTEAGLWDVVASLYEVAKASGEKIPGDVYDWLRQDLQNIGAWQYRVETVPRTESAALEKLLNEVGAERWECIWIEREGSNYRLIFKRPAKSYLKTIPEWDVLRLLRGDEEGNE
ncbi:MAG: hypothetical protein GY716_20490 [bacterium]|nr:hypothetical protein [bacterium]